MYFYRTCTEWFLGRVTHVTSIDEVRGYLGVNDLTFGLSFWNKKVTISTYFDIFSWHNYPWVESHMWPQQTCDQRSSWGHWPLSTFFHVLHWELDIYYKDCKSMWLRKQAKVMVREPPCFCFCLFCFVLFCFVSHACVHQFIWVPPPTLRYFVHE